MQPAERGGARQISAILLVWLASLLLWPDDAAESDWHGRNRFEARLTIPQPRRVICGRYPTGYV
jgi:hypothetical protein